MDTTKPNTTKPNTITQDQLIRDIFSLYEKHGESGIPKARMLLAKYTRQEVTAFAEVADCNTRLKVADELEVEADKNWYDKDSSSDGHYALKGFAETLRQNALSRGATIHSCSPDEST